jgi:hypothetical protein
MAECERINFITKNEQGVPHPVYSTDCSTEPLIRQLQSTESDKIVFVGGNMYSDAYRLPGHGTGFFVGQGDQVVTALHVALMGDLTVTDKDKKQYRATLERADDSNDLALLKLTGITPDPKRAVDVEHPAQLREGTTTVTFGYPNGPDFLIGAKGQYQFTKPMGPTPNGIGSELSLQKYLKQPRLWGTDSPLPGFSGGPRFDVRGTFAGETIGVSGQNQMSLSTTPEKVSNLMKAAEDSRQFMVAYGRVHQDSEILRWLYAGGGAAAALYSPTARILEGGWALCQIYRNGKAMYQNPSIVSNFGKIDLAGDALIATGAVTTALAGRVGIPLSLAGLALHAVAPAFDAVTPKLVPRNAGESSGTRSLLDQDLKQILKEQGLGS